MGYLTTLNCGATAKTSKNLNRSFSIFSDVSFESFDTLTKENYDMLNRIYDLGNTYVHASKNLSSSKTNARKIIMDVGKVLFDIYGIESTEELMEYEMEAAYRDYPDICSGINSSIEVFASPEDAMRGYLNIPSEQFLQKMRSIAGKWNGN